MKCEKTSFSAISQAEFAPTKRLISHPQPLAAFLRECVVRRIATMLQASDGGAKQSCLVCAATMETFATGMTLRLSSGKVQPVVFSGSFGALYVPLAAH